jgi:amino acid permease
VLGPILILIGAMISYYTGCLLVVCAERTKRSSYEDFAVRAYGPKCAKFSSIVMALSLIGFVITYIVLVYEKL